MASSPQCRQMPGGRSARSLISGSKNGGIVSGKDRVARPARLAVTGSIDPRLSFGEGGDVEDGGSGPRSPGPDGRSPGCSSGTPCGALLAG